MPASAVSTTGYLGEDVQRQETEVAGAGGSRSSGKPGGWQGNCCGTLCPWAPCSRQGNHGRNVESKMNSVHWSVFPPAPACAPRNSSSVTGWVWMQVTALLNSVFSLPLK